MNQLKDSANRVPFGGRARPVPFRAKPSLDLGPPKPKSRAGRRGKTHIPLCISILIFFTLNADMIQTCRIRMGGCNRPDIAAGRWKCSGH